MCIYLFFSCPNVRENTIASLKNAVAHGADMVEFDVQISKDLVPVLYHNFELITSIAKKKGDQKMLVQLPVKSLTLEQLQNLKVYTRPVSLYQQTVQMSEFSD